MQIELLKKSVKQPIVANQLQLSITNATMISAGIKRTCSMTRPWTATAECSTTAASTISPCSRGPRSSSRFFEGVFLDNPEFSELNEAIDAVAASYGVSNTTIAIAWILRLPAKMQPVTGTMNLDRLKACIATADVELSREEWHRIYMAAGNKLS